MLNFSRSLICCRRAGSLSPGESKGTSLPMIECSGLGFQVLSFESAHFFLVEKWRECSCDHSSLFASLDPVFAVTDEMAVPCGWLFCRCSIVS